MSQTSDPGSTSSEGPTTVYIASIGRRLGALIYDSLLVLALWMATTLALVIITSDVVDSLWVQLLCAAEWAGFYLYAWCKSGQTVGMVAWRIKTLQPDGNLPSLKQSIARLVVAPISFASLLVGYLWMYVDKERRTWHDMASETVVVHFPKEDN
ncbi:MAG: RDD family protein [Pseudomonadota bacterium]